MVEHNYLKAGLDFQFQLLIQIRLVQFIKIEKLLYSDEHTSLLQKSL